MINAELLVEEGYMRFVDAFKTSKEHYICSYQKSFYDEKGKKMYITFNSWKPYPEMPDFAIPNYSFEAYAQLQTNGETFNVEFFVRADRHSIADVEEFFFKMFDVMGCSHYEEYN